MNKFYSLLVLAVALPTFAAQNTPTSKICMIAQTLASLDTSSKMPAMIRFQSTKQSDLQSMLKNLTGPDDDLQANFPAPKNHRIMNVSVNCDAKKYNFVCYGEDGEPNIQCNSRNIR